MASPEQWGVGSEQWELKSWKWAESVGNFVFSLFHIGNATAVGYNSASGKWGVKSEKCRVGHERG